MLIPYENRQIFIASKPVDFRMSIDGLATFVGGHKNLSLLDGSVYVFYNKHMNKIKCLFWDRNGFVMYYKRLDQCRFKLKRMFKDIESISPKDLEVLLAGLEPQKAERHQLTLEHKE